MSYLASEWASENAPVADTYERIILMKLAGHVNDDGTGAWPSVPSMARAALCDPETVRRRLRAMKKRGLISVGDQQHVSHYRADRRPTVYDLLIPADWYSEQQLAKVNQQRSESSQAPLTSENRPPIAPPSQRRKRADAGVPNAKRSPKNSEHPHSAAPLSEGPPDPVDNSRGPSLRGADDPSLSRATAPLSEGQIRPYEPVQKTIRPSGSNSQPASEGDEPDTDDQLQTERHESAVCDGTFGAELVYSDELRADLERIDLLPAVKKHQQRQIATLVEAVNRAALRFPPEQIARHLLDKARTAKTVKFLLAGLTEYVDDIKTTAVPGYQTQAKQDGQVLSQIARPHNSNVRKAQRPMRMPLPEPDLTSPVSWLADEQFAALSPLDRAALRVAASSEHVPTKIAPRVAAIRTRHDPATTPSARSLQAAKDNVGGLGCAGWTSNPDDTDSSRESNNQTIGASVA